jgi:hypothetical protein
VVPKSTETVVPYIQGAEWSPSRQRLWYPICKELGGSQTPRVHDIHQTEGWVGATVGPDKHNSPLPLLRVKVKVKSVVLDRAMKMPAAGDEEHLTNIC